MNSTNVIPDGISVETTKNGAEPKDMPDSVLDFINKIEVPEEFRVALIRLSGGAPGIIKEFKSDEVEDCEYDKVGCEYGPGKYQWKVSWKNEVGQGRQKSFTRNLAPDEYQEKWEQNELAKQRRKKVILGLEGKDSPNNTQSVQEQFDLAVKLAEKMTPPQPTYYPQQNDGIKATDMMMMQQESSKMMMTMMSGMMTMMGNVMVASMNRPLETNNGGSEQMFEKVLNAAMKIAEVKNMLTPSEKESFVEKMVNMVGDNIPMILNLVSMKAEEREKNMTYQMVKNSKTVRKMEENPDLKKEVVEKMAEKVGLANTKAVLEILDWHDFDAHIDKAMEDEEEILSDELQNATPSDKNKETEAVDAEYTSDGETLDDIE